MIAAAAAAIALQVLSPDDSFKSGDFTGAATAYRARLAANPNDAAAQLGVARIELYSNHLDAAERAARAAIALDPNDAAAQRVIMGVTQRRAVLAESAHLNVPAAGVRIPFIAIDPLPLMQITINGRPANVLLDTGGPDITVDPDFAREAGIATRATGQMGTFAGNRQAAMVTTQIKSVVAGGVTVSNLRADVMPSHGLDFFPGRKVDAVMGTTFLSRFLATIDYPHNQLILQPRSSHVSAPSNATTMPFWFVGDHFLFARGTLNADENVIMLIDSGMAGGGFGPNNDVIQSAHVKTFPDRATQGIGGGGPVTIVPAVADRLCLGTLCQNAVEGSYSPSGSPLQIFPFHVEATVSHTFLKRYAVSLDFDRMQLTFAP